MFGGAGAAGGGLAGARVDALRALGHGRGKARVPQRLPIRDGRRVGIEHDIAFRRRVEEGQDETAVLRELLGLARLRVGGDAGPPQVGPAALVLGVEPHAHDARGQAGPVLAAVRGEHPEVADGGQDLVRDTQRVLGGDALVRGERVAVVAEPGSSGGRVSAPCLPLPTDYTRGQETSPVRRVDVLAVAARGGSGRRAGASAAAAAFDVPQAPGRHPQAPHHHRHGEPPHPGAPGLCLLPPLPAARAVVTASWQ